MNSRPNKRPLGSNSSEFSKESGRGRDGSPPASKKPRTLEEVLSQQSESPRGQIHNERILKAPFGRNGSASSITTSPLRKSNTTKAGESASATGPPVPSVSSRSSSTAIDRATPSTTLNSTTSTSANSSVNAAIAAVAAEGLREPSPPKNGTFAIWTDADDKYVIDFVEWRCEVYKTWVRAGGDMKAAGGWSNKLNRKELGRSMEEKVCLYLVILFHSFSSLVLYQNTALLTKFSCCLHFRGLIILTRMVSIISSFWVKFTG